MKCDELKALVFSISDLAYVDEPTSQPNFQNPHYHAVYKATEVDEAIAQLKEKLHDVVNKWNEQCKEIAELKAKNRVLQSFYDLHGNVDNYIDQLKAKLESVQASAYVDSVDAGMRERRLRRALYKACANWADVEVFERTVGIGDPNVEANRWALMRNKCLKKAEEYK